MIFTDLDRVSYELDDVKFQENELNDPFIEAFIAHLVEIFAPYKVSKTLFSPLLSLSSPFMHLSPPLFRSRTGWFH